MRSFTHLVLPARSKDSRGRRVPLGSPTRRVEHEADELSATLIRQTLEILADVGKHATISKCTVGTWNMSGLCTPLKTEGLGRKLLHLGTRVFTVTVNHLLTSECESIAFPGYNIIAISLLLWRVSTPSRDISSPYSFTAVAGRPSSGSPQLHERSGQVKYLPRDSRNREN